MRTPRSTSTPTPEILKVRRRVRRGSILAVALVLVAGLVIPAGTAAASPVPQPPHASGQPNLGDNVVIFDPTMSRATIQKTVDAISAQQIPNQFGTQRYSLFFRPGTYGTPTDPLIFQVGYYTQVAGLGQEPGDVTINGSVDVYNQCFPSGDLNNCVALDNFWRSMSNLTINVAGGSGCQTKTEFWAVSQAAPMRRVTVNGGASLMDYCNGGPDYASGGFIADSKFTGASVTNGSQQQFLVRNSDLDGWTNGVWNQVFSGTLGAPAQGFGIPGSQPYTTLATSPVTADAPYLYTDAKGNFRVMVPKVLHNSVGPSWATGTAGKSLPIKDFFIANPNTSVSAINIALALGKNLILTPGVYNLKQSIQVSRPDTVILGLGLATLSPQRGNVAMKIGDVPGTKLSGVIFDAGPVNSPVLLQVGTSNRPGFGCGGKPTDPTQIQDVFFRIGGAGAGKATTSLVVNSSNVILDDIWAWRADHGTGVGWTTNTADTGLIVNGDNVTAYGLFVEHYQKTEVIWNGNGGTDIFFQNEMPYDPPSQAAWNLSKNFNGYPAFVVSPKVKSFQGYGMGSYSFFNQGVDIHATAAFEVPQRPGCPAAQPVDSVPERMLAESISIINGTGAPVDRRESASEHADQLPMTLTVRGIGSTCAPMPRSSASAGRS